MGPGLGSLGVRLELGVLEIRVSGCCDALPRSRIGCMFSRCRRWLRARTPLHPNTISIYFHLGAAAELSLKPSTRPWAVKDSTLTAPSQLKSGLVDFAGYSEGWFSGIRILGNSCTSVLGVLEVAVPSQATKPQSQDIEDRMGALKSFEERTALRPQAEW